MFQRLVEVASGVNKADVAEGLGKVAQELPGDRVNHLRKESQVVGLLRP